MDLLPFTTFWLSEWHWAFHSLHHSGKLLLKLAHWPIAWCDRRVAALVVIPTGENILSTERYLNSTSRFRLKSKCWTVRSIKATESSCFFLGTVWSSCEAWAAIHRPWRACDIFSVCDRVFRPAVSPRIWRWMSAAWWTRWGRRSCNWCKKELASSAVSG